MATSHHTARQGAAGLDVLATQLTAALDGPLLLYLSSDALTGAAPQVSERLGRAGRTWSSASAGRAETAVTGAPGRGLHPWIWP